MKTTRYMLTIIAGAALSASIVCPTAAITVSDEPSYRTTSRLSEAIGLSDMQVAGNAAKTRKPTDEVFTILAASTKPRKPARRTARRPVRTDKRAIRTSQRRQLRNQRLQGQKQTATFDNLVGFYQITDTNGGIDTD